MAAEEQTNIPPQGQNPQGQNPGDSYDDDDVEDNGNTGGPQVPEGPENTDGDKPVENPIDNNFSINFNVQIQESSSDFAKAYEVTGKKFQVFAGGEAPELYALVFDRGFPVRSDVIKYIQNLEVADPLLPVIHDTGLIKVPSTNTVSYAMILQYPKGKTLREVFAGNPPPEKLFVQNIFAPLCGIVSVLSEGGMVHGSINIDNIYYDPTTEKLTLGEYFSGPCGYNQPLIYEPIERAQCDPIAKGDKDTTTDYFALGVIVLFMITGKMPMEEMRDKEILETRLFKNSFLTLTQGVKLSTPMGELLRGLLADKSERRWGRMQVDNWLRNKSNQTSSTPSKEAMRGFIYNDKEYFNCRSLVYALDKDFDKAKTSLKVADLGRWLKHSLLNNLMAERFESLSFQSRKTDPVILEDGDVYRIMSVLDSTGPIRYSHYDINIYGIGPFLAHSFAVGSREHIQLVGDMFNTGLVSFWLDLSDPAEGAGNDSRTSILPWDGRKLSKLVRNPNLGFGIERALYEMNRTMPCLSPLLSQHYVTDLKELLLALDELAKKNPQKDPVDRHIAAFIATKIDLRDDINIRNIAEFEFVSKSPQLIMLAFLVAAQTQSRVRNLRNLAGWLADKMVAPLSKLHGSSAKKEIIKNMKRIAREGDLARLLNFISNPEYLKKDKFSFKEAARYYRELGERIALLQQQENTEKLAYEYGLRISVALGYVVCVATLLYLLSGI